MRNHRQDLRGMSVHFLIPFIKRSLCSKNHLKCCREEHGLYPEKDDSLRVTKQTNKTNGRSAGREERTVAKEVNKEPPSSAWRHQRRSP
jgi:hypothetical protein